MAALNLGTIPGGSGLTLDRVNDALRASPAWQAFMRRTGQTGPRIHLSDAARRQLQQELARAGVPLPRGMNIDPAGNINEENQGFFQNRWVQAALIGAAALATAGAAGFGPLAGLLGQSGGALSGAAIPGLHAAVPGAVASQGVSAMVPLASSSIAGLSTAVPGSTSLLPSSSIPSLYGTLPSSSIPGLYATPGGSGAASYLPGGGTGVSGSNGGGGGGGGGNPSLSRQLLGYGLQYGLPAAGGLVSTWMQGNAARDAAQIMADYYDRALEVEKEKEQYGRGQRADYLGRLAPYGAAGTASLGDMQGLLAGSSYQPYAGGVQPGGGGTVKMLAPDGSTNDVPAHLEAYYSAKGAKRA